MQRENETNGSKLLKEFLTILKEDSQRGYKLLLILDIPTQVSEEFEKKIMSDPKHHGESDREA